MTDARMPGRWLFDPAMDSLTDRAWRTYVGSLMWSAEQGTDGYLPKRSLRHLHPEGLDDTTAAELVAAGRWRARPDGDYQVVDWDTSQSLNADVQHQLERNRQKNRDLRKREREKRAGHDSGHLPGHVTGHVGGEERQGRKDEEPQRDYAHAHARTHAREETLPTGVASATPDAIASATSDVRPDTDRTPTGIQADEGLCRRCGVSKPVWILASREGHCITCHQTIRAEPA